MTIDDKIRAALSNGKMDTYSLAEIIWPHETFPKAWNCQSNGGPPGWVRPLGKAIKRMKLNVTFNNHRKIVSLP